MSEPPGAQAALGIETVESSANGEHLTVRVTGRWRRRRPAMGGQPTLVVESNGGRHHFPATPEPPGVNGTAPGIWRISFSVPAALAPDVATRSRLLFGGVVVRLPEAVEVATPMAEIAPPMAEVAPPVAETAPPMTESAPPERRIESHARRAELAVGELAARIQELERVVTQARVESGRLLGTLADRTRARRVVEQLADAERHGLSGERRLVALRAAAASHNRVGSEPAASARAKPAPAAGAEPVLALADTERELGASIAQLRAELRSLHTDLEHERAARTRAERHAAELERSLVEQRTRTDRASTAIEELREALGGLRATGLGAPVVAAGRSIEPERFSDALVRLRETIAPADVAEVLDAAPEIVVRPWLARAFATLARKDAARAGRLLLDLLPAQGAAYDGAVAYDLVLGRDVGTVAVTLRDGRLKLASRSSPRELTAVDFQAIGSPGRIARLLSPGRVRRRTRLGLARVRGDRRHLEALRALIRTPLSLAELHDAGVRIDPQLALTLVSLMIEPSWTEGEEFTLALEEAGAASAFLKIRGRSRPRVLEAESPERVTTTVVVAAESLLALLAGQRAVAAEIRGDDRALSTLLEWIKRAQCG
jgi:hypothetical protein